MRRRIREGGTEGVPLALASRPRLPSPLPRPTCCPLPTLSTRCLNLPDVSFLRIHDGKESGIIFSSLAKGRLVSCDVFNHTSPSSGCGVFILRGSRPTSITGCTFRNNRYGAFVKADSLGASPELESSNTFRGNARDDVRRMGKEEAEGEGGPKGSGRR